MPIGLREMTREAVDAILAGERPGDVRVAADSPTEFPRTWRGASVTSAQLGPFFRQRCEDDVVVGEIGGAFVDEEETG